MKRFRFVLAPGEPPGAFRRNQPPAARRGLRPDRSGATLSEILIALMVMGIGVTSLALLISTSVVRSIQATQLTSSTIHRINAQHLIELYPRIIHNPDYPYNTDLTGHNTERFIVDPLGWGNSALRGVKGTFGNDNSAYPANYRIRYPGGFFPRWKPNNDYQVSQGGQPGNVVVAATLRSTTLVYEATQTGISGTVEPTWPTTAGATVNDGTVEWTAVAYPNAYPAEMAYLPDSWQLAVQGMTPTYIAPNAIRVPATVDLQTPLDTFNALGAGSVRIVLFSDDGQGSVVRNVTAIDPTTNFEITWDDDLPATGYTAPSRYRLEFVDPRYSWILTVRKKPNALFPAGDAEVDVVVFHKRDFSAAAEQSFELAANVSVGDTQFMLDLTSTNALTPVIKPFLKRGSFVFDAQNMQWYRVVQVVEDAVNPVVTIDRAAIAGIQAGNANGPDIMAMTGVVEVYPLGTLSYDPNNPP